MKSRAVALITVLAVISLGGFFPETAHADHVIKAKKHTDAVSFMGQTQPAKDEDVITWLGKDRMRQDEGDTTTLVRFDMKKIYMINHGDKTYAEIDLPIDLEKVLPPDAKQMMDTIEMSSSVTDTGETKTINTWKCKKYLAEISVTMMGMSMPITLVLWTSKDLGIDADMYKKFYTETLSLNPMFKGFVEEFTKMEGYPVRTEFTMSMMGAEQKYWEEVVSVEKSQPPEGTYDLPEGYTKTAYNPFQQRR